MWLKNATKQNLILIKELMKTPLSTRSRRSWRNCGMQHPLFLLVINLWQHYFKSKFSFLCSFPGFFHSCFTMGLRRHVLLHIHVNVNTLVNPSGSFKCSNFPSVLTSSISSADHSLLPSSPEFRDLTFYFLFFFLLGLLRGQFPNFFFPPFTKVLPQKLPKPRNS